MDGSPHFGLILLYFMLYFGIGIMRFGSNIFLTIFSTGGGGGSVGRAVASNLRGLWFESSHWQKFILNIYCQLYWKDQNKEKEAGNGPN